MPGVNRKFFKNGVDNQRRSDISIDLKRPKAKDMKAWTIEQKIIARAFMEESDVRWMEYRREILNNLL